MKEKIATILRLIFSKKFIIILLLLLQIYLFTAIIFSLVDYSNIITALSIIISIIAAVKVLNNEKYSPEYKIAWLVPILTVPIFAGIAYFFLKTQYERKLFKKTIKKEQERIKKNTKQDASIINEIKQDKTAPINLFNYINKCSGFPVYKNTQTKYFSSGELLFQELKEKLEAAQNFIFFEFFIIDKGAMWHDILEILTRKASEGVDVRLIYDGMGSQVWLPDGYNKHLREKGIKCQVFNPFRPFLSTVQNNRDHRKIVVIDGNIAFTGGINIADEYINKKQRFGHWKDTGIMITGDAVWSFTLMFLEMWNVTCGQGGGSWSKYRPTIETASDGYIIPYGDEPVNSNMLGETVYLNIINNAKKYVYFTTPYLIPDHNILFALKMAAKSGIDVRIITPSRPDKWYTHVLTQSFYKELISAGVKIYEYSKGFVHSKIFVSDDTTATVGTINMDYRSLYLHFECSTYLYKSGTVKDVKSDFLDTLKDCNKITTEYCAKIPMRRKFAANILRILSPLL